MKEAKILNSLLEETRVVERKRHADFMAKMARIEEERNERVKKAGKLFMGKLRRARVKDYKDWLAGFLGEGNRPTHYYDYPMERGLDRWKVALSDFPVIPLFGADALHIIIPNGVRFLGGELGHSNLFFMDGFSHIGDWVPIYSDIHF